MPSLRSFTHAALVLCCMLLLLLARCGTNHELAGVDSSKGNGVADSGADGSVELEPDGGTDGGERSDGGSGRDGGSDGGVENDGGSEQNDAGSGISYRTDIKPIFEMRCESSGCHGPPIPGGGLDLTAEDSRDNLVNRPTSCQPSVPRVAPGDPEGSMLWRKCKPLPLPDRCGGIMPLGTMGLGVIAPEDFAKIEKWIQQGALDN